MGTACQLFKTTETLSTTERTDFSGFSVESVALSVSVVKGLVQDVFDQHKNFVKSRRDLCQVREIRAQKPGFFNF
jgi:hypothetical protein